MGTKNVSFSPLTSMAAVVIQAHWRGHIMRKQIHFSTRLTVRPPTSRPNSCINNKTILKKGKKENIQEQREKAAILIQVSFNLLVKLLIMRDVSVIFHWVILYKDNLQILVIYKCWVYFLLM